MKMHCGTWIFDSRDNVMIELKSLALICAKQVGALLLLHDANNFFK